MRLFEAIIEANHKAIAGDPNAGVRVVEFENELPVVALTCVDPRLNALFPNVLGLPGEQFIWLRNAGNIITGPLSSTMRSLALSCAVKGGREIAVIGHSDCQVAKTTTMALLDQLKALGVDRSKLPENLNEFFGTFGSERQNVIKACNFVRQSPLIGPKIPVHGLLVDIVSGGLEWLVNGYQTFQTMASYPGDTARPNAPTGDLLKTLPDFKIGEMKFPETKIGEGVVKPGDHLAQKIGQPETKPPAPAPAPKPESPASSPPKIPMPPPIRPRLQMRRPGK